MTETMFTPFAPQVADPERSLALSYAPRAVRDGLAALWALDETLGDALRGGREPTISLMRLTWWHDALGRLDDAPPPAQPVLQALARDALPRGVTGAALATMIDGWELLLDPDPVDTEGLRRYAAARGGTLFRATSQVLGATDARLCETAGQGWALVDLARHVSDQALATAAMALAVPLLEDAVAPRWRRAERPIGMLAHLALVDARAGSAHLRLQGAPRRVARMFYHALTGR